MESKAKKKLKRRGPEIYFRYFYNQDDKLYKIIDKYDNKIDITEDDYDVMFDLPIHFRDKILELIYYYPKELRKRKTITVEDIDDIYEIYGETMDIMRNSNSLVNVRGKLRGSISTNGKNRNILVNINSEDILLKKECPILGIPIIYGNSYTTDNSPSIDRINNDLDYTKENIQLVSMLANRMKNSANNEQLIKFAEYIFENYKI